MGYLTLTINSPVDEPLFETDLSLSVFIPLVRHVTRALETRDYMAQYLKDYRAIITPRYSGRPSADEYILPRQDTNAVNKKGMDVLTITEDDMPVVDSAAYEAEIHAYYHPDHSPLCTQCSEQQRCPGSGFVQEANLQNWIELDPQGMITNEVIRFFTLRLENKEGDRFYQHDFLIPVLHYLIKALSTHLLKMNRLPMSASGHNTAVFIARYTGVPQINPLISQLKIQPKVEKSTELVDWDLMEAEREDDDLEINVIDTQKTQLPLRLKPRTIDFDSVGIIDSQDISIFVRRSVLQALRQNKQQETQGVLIGTAARNPTDQQPFVEINHFIDASEAFSEGAAPTFSFELWQYVEKRLASDFPGQQIIGWYRVHLLGAALLTIQAGSHTIHATTTERLFVSEEERFIQQSFFAEAWHILLIVDPIDDQFRFYSWQDTELTAVSGYFIV